MKRNMISQSLFLVVFGVSLNAQDYNVSLKEAITIALQNNQKLKVSQTSIKIAETIV